MTNGNANLVIYANKANLVILTSMPTADDMKIAYNFAIDDDHRLHFFLDLLFVDGTKKDRLLTF